MFTNLKPKTILPNLMIGSLWFVNENEDLSLPITLKEFKRNINGDDASALLSHGNVIPKDEKAEQHIIFDCYQPEYDVTSSFRLFLYSDGTVSGRIGYPIDYEAPKEYFKGNFIMNSKSKITIWGLWSVDVEQKEKYLTLIELVKRK